MKPPVIPPWTPPPPIEKDVIDRQFAEARVTANRIRQWFDMEVDENQIVLDTRANGSVGDETPGKEDVDHAREMLKILRTEHPHLKIDFEVVDEWTHVTIRREAKTPPSRPPLPDEFWQQVFDVALEAIKAEIPVLDGAEITFPPGELPRLRIPLTRHEDKDHQSIFIVNERARKLAQAALGSSFEVRMYGIECKGIATAGFSLCTLPKWVLRDRELVARRG